jgi:hypothetical protein
VSTAIKDLALSPHGKCLCHQSQRKRLPLVEALRTLSALGDDAAEQLDEGGMAPMGPVANSAVEAAVEAAVDSISTPSDSTPMTDTGSTPALTPLSMQVRALRKGTDVREGVKDNMLLAFGKLMARLDAVYAERAVRAPEAFEERINYWHGECGMPSRLKEGMHRLRVWSNAARHMDDHRWQRDGPKSVNEASQRVAAVEQAIEALERSPRRGA